MRKAVIALSLFALAVGALALFAPTPAMAAKGNCSFVRCAACPDGYHLSLHWPNCCACLPNR